jgi:hypothetical protein
MAPTSRIRESRPGEDAHDVDSGGVQVLSDLGELARHGVEEAVVLGVDGGGVGLVIDRVQQGLDPGPGRFRCRGHQVRGARRR